MSDTTTSLIISIISLSGTILATAIGAYATYYNEERKAKREVDKILLKYRDPLLLSARDLQARLYGLCETDQLEFLVMDEEGETTFKDAIYIYTAYVVGQYLSWAWIMRRQAQFRAIMSSGQPKWSNFGRRIKHSSAAILMQKIDLVSLAFRDNQYGIRERGFMLFNPHQMGIGEIMSCLDANTGEYHCIGYATFMQRWHNGDPQRWKGEDHDHSGKSGEHMAGVANIPDKDFRAAFRSIERGLDILWEHRQHSKELDPERPNNEGYDGRLRRLQHLLLDLMEELDPAGLLNNEQELTRVVGMPGCRCTVAPCHIVPRSRPPERRVAGSSNVAVTGAIKAENGETPALHV